MNSPKNPKEERNAQVDRDNRGNIFTGDIEIGGDLIIKHQPVLYILLVLAVVLGSLLVVFFMSQDVDPIANGSSVDTPTPSAPTPGQQQIIASFTPIPSDKVGILIADFSVSSTDHTQLNMGRERADILYEELQREKTEQAITRVTIRRLPVTIKNHSEAITWGSELNMQIVIWGELKSEKVIIPKFELINFSNITYGLGDEWLLIYAGAVQPDPIVMGQELSDRITSLATFTIGLSYLVSLSSEKVETNYDRAIGQFGKLIDNTTNKQAAVIYLNYRGLIYSFKNEYEKAKNDYDEALRINPTDANTFVNLGGWYARLHHRTLFFGLNNNAQARDMVPRLNVVKSGKRQV